LWDFFLADPTEALDPPAENFSYAWQFIPLPSVPYHRTIEINSIKSSPEQAFYRLSGGRSTPPNDRPRVIGVEDSPFDSGPSLTIVVNSAFSFSSSV
jgi:hypothetical protein